MTENQSIQKAKFTIQNERFAFATALCLGDEFGRNSKGKIQGSKFVVGMYRFEENVNMTSAGTYIEKTEIVMGWYIQNGLGKCADFPTEAKMWEFLQGAELLDEEHGAAWLIDEFENSLEFNRDGRLVFSRGENDPVHLIGISKERAIELWLKLVDGRIDEVEREPWQPGLCPPLSPEKKKEIAEFQRRTDRDFFDVLGKNVTGEPCRTPECERDRITYSIFCRVHHFENIQGRPCPFDDKP